MLLRMASGEECDRSQDKEKESEAEGEKRLSFSPPVVPSECSSITAAPTYVSKIRKEGWERDCEIEIEFEHEKCLKET